MTPSGAALDEDPRAAWDRYHAISPPPAGLRVIRKTPRDPTKRRARNRRRKAARKAHG